MIHPHDEEVLEALLAKYEIRTPRCVSSIGRGWLPLVEKLIQDLIAMGWNRQLHQVKEKFGGLRFYVGEASPEVVNRIDQAEADSLQVCEACGSPGTKRPDGWVRTLCDGCAP